MTSFLIIPTVDQAQEFIEIANDFANPLDLVREAISNAFDANARNIEIAFSVRQIAGESTLVIDLRDDGDGMGRPELQSFFDLGNSTRRENIRTIGEKGHGTKVYFNARKVTVVTARDGVEFTAVLDAPFSKLHDRKVPEVEVTEELVQDSTSGTHITILGYNNNRREKFSHSQLRDYILWFTKFGSIETMFDITQLANTKLRLKGLDRDDFELLSFGHPFPPESAPVTDLFDMYTIQAPNHYCRRIVSVGSLPNRPEARYHAIFSIEGRKVKYDSNPMLRRQGANPLPGAYQVQERYGLWLCKDFIPVQRKNEWIATKGSEFTKFHAFVNCQQLRLTANRGSVDNTPSEILQDIEKIVRVVYDSIIERDDWLNLSWLESEAEGYNTVEKEKKNFLIRKAKVNQSNIAHFEGAVLVEPKRESGVHSLIVQLLTVRSNALPFSIVDYDTLEGIDVIVKANDNVAVRGSRLYYVEFKYVLSTEFNHSFENLHSIVCWDTDLKHGEIIKDVNNQERRLSICAPDERVKHTCYFLDSPRSAHRIEVFVLKDYLPQALGISFRPRTAADVY